MCDKRFQFFKAGFELLKFILNATNIPLPGIDERCLQKKSARLCMECTALAHERIGRWIGIRSYFHTRITFERGTFLPIILSQSAGN